MSGNACYTTVTAILNQTPCILFTLTVTTFIRSGEKGGWFKTFTFSEAKKDLTTSHL